MRALIALSCAVFVLAGIACGDDGGDGADSPTETPATAVATTPDGNQTQEPSGTPQNAALVDDVIDLAVQLETMTREQAVCVFQDHPSIFQEFLQESGLLTSGVAEDAVLRQQIHDLLADNAVQLDPCFNPAAG